MYLDNPIIVLIASLVLKDKNDITTYRQLQEFLPLEKSQISQALKTNEEADLLQKPEGNKYFSQIKITDNGILKAQRYISFLKKLVRVSSSPLPTNKPRPKPNNPPTPPNITSFIEKSFSPLKSTLKKSLQDYIPESHLTADMLEDITDDILSFFQNRLEKFP